MAGEHLNTNREAQEIPKNGGSVKPEDFSSEIDVQLGQLITLSELLRFMEDGGQGFQQRNGFFYGLGDIIEGCADQIKSMLKPMYEHMFQRGKERGFERVFEMDEESKALVKSPDFLVFKGGILLHVGLLDQLVTPLMVQEAEISPEVMTNFQNNLRSWRESFEKFINEKGAGL